jgi:quercetin dioxygenase-like cupin family protein
MPKQLREETHVQDQAHPQTNAPDTTAGYASPFSAGFVLQIDEGEVLSSGSTRHIIKVSPGTHTQHLGVVASQYGEGQGIPIHQHQWDEEVFWVHKGRGTFLLGDRRLPIREGCLVYIPPGTWHGFENEAAETLMVWVLSPPHFVDLFRQVLSGEPMSPEERERLFREHGFEMRAP